MKALQRFSPPRLMHIDRHRSEVDTFLPSRSIQSFLVQLPARLQLPAQEAMLCGTRYNVPLLNALVFYVGIQVCSPHGLMCPCNMNLSCEHALWHAVKH